MISKYVNRGYNLILIGCALLLFVECNIVYNQFAH